MSHLREDGDSAKLVKSSLMKFKTHQRYAMVWLGVFSVCVVSLCLIVLLTSLSTDSEGIKALAAITLIGFGATWWYASPRH